MSGARCSADRRARSDVENTASPATTPARVKAVVATTSAGIAWRQSQADGTAAVQPLQGIAAQGVLEKDSRLAWDSLDPGGVAVQARRELPDWLAGPARPDRLEQAARQLALPTLLVYVVAGKYFVRGLTAGAVKG